MELNWIPGFPPDVAPIDFSKGNFSAQQKDYFKRAKCLAVSEDGVVFMLGWDGDAWGNFGETGRGFKLRYEVTHWMPVPEAPHNGGEMP